MQQQRPKLTMATAALLRADERVLLVRKVGTNMAPGCTTFVMVSCLDDGILFCSPPASISQLLLLLHKIASFRFLFKTMSSWSF